MADHYFDDTDPSHEEYNKQNDINYLREEVKRLTKIVESPWKCDVCGNYLGNNSAVLEE